MLERISPQLFRETAGQLCKHTLRKRRFISDVTLHRNVIKHKFKKARLQGMADKTE